ncbi:hypothetical protein [Paraburkholderia fynbosensis]|uniref:Uncharacterized protein n=1 Tax=Paraburkholderia fynbosensis TaxID=1200993 RepID=A0A6J5GCG4_9BURK|nr:hypothetical protein [Paraburkholderia fynbosensis]CAB3797517.1 hypothetical protein LMG27177_04277 [Paraburkholderia fynbosensis]
MRTALRTDPIRFARCAASALIASPVNVHAGTAQPQFAAATHVPRAGTELDATSSTDWTTGTTAESSPLAANTSDAPADAESVNAVSLDDRMLSRQRGGAVGMVMVAATPQLLRVNSGGRVTLWDEIAPPSPLPIPVGAARSARGDVATFRRK